MSVVLRLSRAFRLSFVIVMAVTFAITISFGIDALKAAQGDITNGCGPWGLGAIIPDLTFGDICDQHDLCVQSGQSLNYCAVLFYHRITERCEQNRWFMCQSIGSIYSYFTLEH